MLRANLKDDVRKVTCELDKIDAMRLLDCSADTPAMVKRYATKHWSKKGYG